MIMNEVLKKNNLSRNIIKFEKAKNTILNKNWLKSKKFKTPPNCLKASKLIILQ